MDSPLTWPTPSPFSIEWKHVSRIDRLYAESISYSTLFGSIRLTTQIELCNFSLSSTMSTLCNKTLRGWFPNPRWLDKVPRRHCVHAIGSVTPLPPFYIAVVSTATTYQRWYPSFLSHWYPGVLFVTVEGRCPILSPLVRIVQLGLCFSVTSYLTVQEPLMPPAETPLQHRKT